MPQFTQALMMQSNITILAPSNDAFEKAMKAMPNLTSDMNMVTALLQYHIITGMMMSSAFTETPQFVSTYMGTPFAMVNGNQKVELVKMDNMAMIFSGFKQMSSVTKADIAFDGGVVHVSKWPQKFLICSCWIMYKVISHHMLTYSQSTMSSQSPCRHR